MTGAIISSASLSVLAEFQNSVLTRWTLSARATIDNLSLTVWFFHLSHSFMVISTASF
jgi:hypothetical protein